MQLKTMWKRIKSWFKPKIPDKQESPQNSMNIQEFVQASIVEIMSGIQGAQNEYSEGNSAYCPLICLAWKPPTSDVGGSTIGFSDQIFELEFDLAITVLSTTTLKAGGKAGITVVGIYSGNIGCSSESEGSSSRISRIRFKIPVRYPLTKLGKPKF